MALYQRRSRELEKYRCGFFEGAGDFSVTDSVPLRLAGETRFVVKFD
jgi:hypothetical protein